MSEDAAVELSEDHVVELSEDETVELPIDEGVEFSEDVNKMELDSSVELVRLAELEVSVKLRNAAAVLESSREELCELLIGIGDVEVLRLTSDVLNVVENMGIDDVRISGVELEDAGEPEDRGEPENRGELEDRDERKDRGELENVLELDVLATTLDVLDRLDKGITLDESLNVDTSDTAVDDVSEIETIMLDSVLLLSIAIDTDERCSNAARLADMVPSGALCIPSTELYSVHCLW